MSESNLNLYDQDRKTGADVYNSVKRYAGETRQIRDNLAGHMLFFIACSPDRKKNTGSLKKSDSGHVLFIPEDFIPTPGKSHSANSSLKSF